MLDQGKQMGKAKCHDLFKGVVEVSWHMSAVERHSEVNVQRNESSRMLYVSFFYSYSVYFELQSPLVFFHS